MNFVAAVLAVVTAYELRLWYRQIEQRDEEGSAYQLFLNAPRVSRFGPRGRRVVAHVGIAIPMVVLLAITITVAVLITA